MITPQECDELVRKGREDGKRLFQVVEGMYKFLITMNWVIGIVGGLIGLGLLVKGLSSDFLGSGAEVLAGIACLGLTALYCVGLYAAAVLMTHGAKVLVHILFSNLAIMESNQP